MINHRLQLLKENKAKKCKIFQILVGATRMMILNRKERRTFNKLAIFKEKIPFYVAWLLIFDEI